MNKSSDHLLIKIQPYAVASRPDGRMSVDPVPDVEKRSIHLETEDGDSVMRGAAQGLRWSSGEIRGVKVVLVVTDQRIGFAIPKCPKPTGEHNSIRFVWWWEFLLYPIKYLLKYAAEARRHARQIGLGHIRYEWIRSVGSGYQERGRRRRAGRQRHGDIVEICYSIRDKSSDDNEELTATNGESASTVNEVHFELAPDLSGEMMAMELAARVCRHRIASFDATGGEPTRIEAARAMLNRVEKDISQFPLRANPNLQYEIPQ